MTERHPREDRHTLSEYLLFSEIFSRRLEKQSGLCPGQRSVNAKLRISLRIQILFANTEVRWALNEENWSLWHSTYSYII